MNSEMTTFNLDDLRGPTREEADLHYRTLAAELLDEQEGLESAPMPVITVDNCHLPIEALILPGDVTTRGDQRICNAVCKYLPHITPDSFLAMDRERRLACIEDALAAKPSPPDRNAPSRRQTQVEAILGDESHEVLEIANSTKKSADDRMRAICGIDRRFVHHNSEQWSNLLSVSSAAIRKTQFWKVDREKAMEAMRAIKVTR